MIHLLWEWRLYVFILGPSILIIWSHVHLGSVIRLIKNLIWFLKWTTLKFDDVSYPIPRKLQMSISSKITNKRHAKCCFVCTNRNCWIHYSQNKHKFSLIQQTFSLTSKHNLYMVVVHWEFHTNDKYCFSNIYYGNLDLCVFISSLTLAYFT